MIEDSRQGIQAGIAANMETLAFFEHQINVDELKLWAKEQGVNFISHNAIELLDKIKNI